MYTVYVKNGTDDRVCIYDPVSPSEKLTLISPKLVMEDNAAGSFSAVIPQTNIGYDIVKRLISDIIICRKVDNSEKVIWTGRIMNENDDFYGNRSIECEGALAFLNDSYQLQQKYLINKKNDKSVNVIAQFLKSLLDVHNASVNENRKIYLGNVTVTDKNNYLYRYTNFDTTFNTIVEKLVNRLGGHLVIRYSGDIAYLDYIADYHEFADNSQTIDFGYNLLDFTKQWDMSYFASAVLPLGKQLDDEEGESPTGVDENSLSGDDDDLKVLEKYVTVEELNDSQSPSGSFYVKAKNQETIDIYGWIAVKIQWDNIAKPETLLEKAKEYLKSLQFDSMYLEVTAFDLSEMNVDYKEIGLLDTVQVYSNPHGLNKKFPVTKLEIPMDDPSGMSFGMGVQVYQPLTGLINNSK